MSNHRIDRVSEDIKRELVFIMRDLKDPRISGMLSIVKVDVSGDLSVAKIYISAMEGVDTARKSVDGLTSAAPFIRRRLSERVKIRKLPELKFIADSSIQYASDISKKMDDISAQYSPVDDE